MDKHGSQAVPKKSRKRRPPSPLPEDNELAEARYPLRLTRARAARVAPKVPSSSEPISYPAPTDPNFQISDKTTRTRLKNAVARLPPKRLAQLIGLLRLEAPKTGGEIRLNLVTLDAARRAAMLVFLRKHAGFYL